MLPSRKSWPRPGRGVPGYGVFGPKDISANLGKTGLALYLTMRYGVHNDSEFARQ